MFTSIGRSLLMVVAWALMPLILIILLGMLLLPPAEVVMQTFDILRMRAQTTGRVTAVSVVKGGHDTARAKISYKFEVAGRNYSSEIMYPGWLTNRSTWTGGGSVAKNYRSGQVVDVYFRASDPQNCALVHGWQKSAIGFLAGLYGIIFAKMSCSHSRLLGSITMGLLVSVFILLFFGPDVVRVSDISICAAVFVVVVGCLYLRALRTRMTPPDIEQKKPLLVEGS